jgi:hypothetical protein
MYMSHGYSAGLVERVGREQEGVSLELCDALGAGDHWALSA